MAISKAAELAKPVPKVDPQILSKAERLLLILAEEYAPAGAVGVVWETSAPSTIGEALDRIAAEVATLKAGPIAE